MADKSEVIQDYLNSLNEAMAIHAKKAVEGLEFDRTELAEIVDITNRDKGQYQVFNGSVRYYAYSENTSYTLGSKVYVTIPNNDYSQQKLIKGKYKSDDGDTGIAWISPLQNYQPTTDNLIEDESLKSKEDEFSNSSIGLEGIPINKDYDNTIGESLLANYNKVLNEQSIETNESSQYASQYVVLYRSQWIQEDSQYNKNYQYMGLSADFKTALSAFYPVSGSYGLMVLIDYSIKLSGEEPLVYKTKVCKLDSSTMIGSIYNFNTFYKQEALFKLDNDPKHGMLINRITVLFYQDGEFRSNDNVLIPPTYNNQLLPDNIFVKNIGIWFGDEIEEDDEDEAEIYTLNGEMYDSAQTNDKLNEKRIHLKWLHVNPVQEEEADGTKKWVKDLMDSSNLTNVPTSADVKLIANIHWYSDAQYTIDTYRANQAEMAASNDHLWEVTEKWKYAPNSLTEDDIKTLVEGTNWSPKKDYDYFWSDEEQRYIFTVTASGEQALERTITRNGKEDKTTSVNDELGGSGWIPIENTWNKFEINFQPDNNRESTSVKCIIEIGPELLAKDEETGQTSKTGLVNPNSTYYTVLETNIITFKNLSWVPDIATHDTDAGITLTIDDKTGGHYPIYNATDGRILSRNEVSRLRTIEAEMISRYTGNSLFNGNEIILWQVPKTNSMININGTLSEDKQEVLTADNFDIISDWFDIEDFNFTDYYYLVRTSLAGAPANQYQGFYINEYYIRSATNNTIFCYVIKNNLVYRGEITLTFAQHGSSGTDYTFSLGLGELVKMPENVSVGGDNNAVDTTSAEWEVVGPAAAAITIGETSFRRIRFELYDAENNIINLTNQEKNAIISKWIVNRLQDGYYSGYNSSTNNKDGNAKNLQFLVKKEGNYFTDVAVRAPQSAITNYRYIILSAAVKQSATSTYNDDVYEVGPVNFVQMLPLHFRTNNTYSLDGADYITYDDKGSNPQSYSNKYDLLNIANEKFNVIVNGTTITTSNQSGAYKYYPHLDTNGKLVPCSIYVSDLDRKVAIEATVGNSIVYTMPLLIIQNRYQIPAINSWNGDLLIDDKNNRVMAATIAAGNKDKENRFTGVIMGDVGQLDSSTGRIKTKSGLYGYHTGAESFGFLSDGTGFIGKSGTGRIEFNGEKGWIQSGNYSATSGSNKSGTRIDLDDGSIDMWGRGVEYKYNPDKNRYEYSSGTATDSTNIHLDVEGSTTKPYFKIEVPKYTTVNNNGTITSTATTSRQSLIQVDRSNFYLQTADYDTTAKTGLRIDLKRGTLDSQGIFRMTAAPGSYIQFGDNLILRSGNNATSTIGGWKISSNSLYNDGITIASSGSRGGSISSSNWGISADGYAWFKNVSITDASTLNLGGQGIGGNGLYFGNGFASFSGDIYANNGYFTGTVSAATITGGTITGASISGGTISGGTISGSTITGGTISGATISASGYVTCSGLTVGGTSYGMTTVESLHNTGSSSANAVSSVDYSTKSITYVTSVDFATGTYSTGHTPVVYSIDANTINYKYLTVDNFETWKYRVLGAKI